MNLREVDELFKRYVVIYKIRIHKNKIMIYKPIPVAELVFIKDYLRFFNESYDDIIVNPKKVYEYRF